MVTPVRFCVDLWCSARRPAVLRRCLIVAAVVGTVLTAVNLGDVIWQGAVDLRVALKIVANFLVPFVVSNLGAMTSLPPSPDTR
ncbi:MAG: hypothetical protein AB7N70_39690 [Dehalococcoidia bacterium]